jgi:hypothetical protein
MLLFSPVSVSIYMHLLALYDLLFFSISAPQPSFTVLVMHLCSLLLLCFILCASCPFYEPFLFCAFQLLHSTSFYTPGSLSTTANFFYVLHFIICVHLLHPLFTMLLRALPVSSDLPNHHCNSSASLVVKPMHPSSQGVMPRFLSLSSSRDSLSSLS